MRALSWRREGVASRCCRHFGDRQRLRRSLASRNKSTLLITRQMPMHGIGASGHALYYRQWLTRLVIFLRQHWRRLSYEMLIIHHTLFAEPRRT